MSADLNSDSKPSSRSGSGIGDVLGYFFRKPDASRPKNFNLRAMHTINKISILMFLVGLLFLVFKLAFR